MKLFTILIFCVFAANVIAADKPSDKIKTTTLGLYLTAIEANEMLKKDSSLVFIDVRTQAELAFLGMAKGVDANIPYMLLDDLDEWDNKKHNFKLSPNSNFLPYFNNFIDAKGLNKNSPIILICRSGNRSAGAANLLAQVGYTKVYSIVDGFEGDKDAQGHRTVNGWKNSRLPWSYKLDEDKMYVEF
jgi:rhodanese-related sulfurtransferase